MGKKELLAEYLVVGRVLPAMARVRSLWRADIPILAYHRIWDVADDNRFPFDVELVSASIADFAWQMDYVRLNFTPITFHTLLQILDGEVEAPPRPVLITFDDGYDDNYHHAFPILAAHEIPATIFLSTGYIDGEQTFWYDRLAQLMLSAIPRPVPIKGWEAPLTFSSDKPSRRAALSRLLTWLKHVPNELRLETLRHIEAELGEAEPHISQPESRPLTWNQVREMSAAGIEFGSHTVSHPILSNLSHDDLRNELTESKHEIEGQIGKPVEVIAYPVGGPTAFNDEVRRAARGAGYRLATSYISGTNVKNNLDHLALRRLHVERYTSRALFASLLNLPELFA